MNWPLSPSAKYTDEGVDLVNSRGTSITHGGVAHVKTAWVQLTAATTRRYSGILFENGMSQAWAGKYIMDLGIGGAGSEEVIIENYYSDSRNAGSIQIACVKYPVAIPEGTRVAVRSQADGAGKKIYPYFIGESMDTIGDYGHSKIVSYGEVLASTNGLTVDPGGVVGTKGAWVEMTAACNEDLAAVYIMCGRDGNAAAGPIWLVDIGIGAAGSEEVVVPNLQLAGSATFAAQNWPPHYGPCPVFVPAGTRIAVRCQSNNAVVGEREIDVVLQGVAA